ncbi:hypothetical protein G352_26762 [Rhodococcus ruber BKS 20-38]|uniref:DUF2470 domain-containing protein n=1 Tax=Rhodococcus ruber BKS 20-38 TaxID=1278076 RepID=M2YS31_9NOCA|nr:DUF2470 domain-containing protein [Rhodococcus ruber]EME51109.1 hypothetical protein G352_26762 [Rhodococcus ruber BKS 20-38]
MPATTALPAPSTAETVRTAVVRADSAVLATDGAAPVTTVLHHLHSDGDLFVVVPDDCAAVALTWQQGAAGLHAVLELTDHSPLRLRNPVRSLIWLRGTAHTVAEPRQLAADIAAILPHPALLDVGHRAELLRLRLTSVVAADTTGAEAVEVADVLAATPDPFADVESAWLEHLEQDHSDLVHRIARHIPAADRRGRIRPLGLDRYGLRLRLESGHGDHDVRIPFPEPVDDADSLGRALRRLVGCPFANGLRARH